MKRKFDEKGAIMVEATIYLPLVICTVIALIYLALFNMQEYMMMYEAQRVAAIAAREVAYPGYENFGMGQNDQIEFNWGSGNTPSDDTINSYYQAYHDGIGDLYREISGISGLVTGYEAEEGNYQADFADAARQSAIIVLGDISEPAVEINKGLLGTNVTVTITHTLTTPTVLQYLGLESSMDITTSAYTYSTNPTSFVRNVNLSVDLTSYVLEKLGWKDNVDGFISKTKEVIGKIL